MTKNANETTKSLDLTEEEALSLLDLCLSAIDHEDRTRSEVLDKLGDLCREFLRTERLQFHAITDSLSKSTHSIAL